MRIPFTKFHIGRSAANRPVTGAAMRSPLNVPGGVMRPEYVRAFRQLEEISRSINDRVIRAMDAATTDNYNADFKGVYGSANTEILPNKYKVRANGRALAQNTPHGKAIIRAYADNVVGDDPFELEMNVGTYAADGTFTEDEKTNRAIEMRWKRFIRKENFTIRKNMDLMEAMRVVEMSTAREGSVIGRLYPDYPFNDDGFAVDFLEEDRLDATYQGKSDSKGAFGAGNPIRGSIEYHPKYNFPLAYWLLTRHPGEFFSQPAIGIGGDPRYFREQVPADRIIHFNNLRTRAEQDVGATDLDAVVQPLWRDFQYAKSLTIAAIASTIKPFVLEKKLPTGLGIPNDQLEQMVNSQGAGLSPVTGQPDDGGGLPNQEPGAQQGNGKPAQVMRPGEERELPWGVEAKILDPKFPIEAAHEFRQDNLREAAVGSGLSYQDVSGDFQNLGFIAGLMCQQPKQRYMRIRQNARIEDLRALFRAWLKATILKGKLDLDIRRLDDFVDGAVFKGQQWEFVNPLVEAQALILLCEAGHLTRQQVQDRLPRGVKFDKLIDQLQKEKEELADHGLNLDEIDVTRPTVMKGEPGQTVPAPGAGASGTGDNAAQPPPKSKPANPVRSGRSAEEILNDLEDLLLGLGKDGAPGSADSQSGGGPPHSKTLTRGMRHRSIIQPHVVALIEQSSNGH